MTAVSLGEEEHKGEAQEEHRGEHRQDQGKGLEEEAEIPGAGDEVGALAEDNPDLV